MAENYKAEMDKVRSARIKLLKDHPFFGDLAFSLPIEFKADLNPPTAATDGRKIYFHPEFVMKIPLTELVFVVAHEIGHCMLMHLIRRCNRTPRRWNVACDVVTNQLLYHNRIGTKPSWVIFEPDIFFKADGLVEKVYDLLPEDLDQDAFDGHLEPDGEDKDDLVADWRSKVAKAAATAKTAGNLTGDLESFIEQLTESKVNWEEHLWAFVTKARGTDRTYAKLNRRMQAVDTIMPGTYGERMGPIVIAADCSGSTDDEMLSQLSAEVNKIVADLRPEKVHVLFFDTEVKKHDEYDADDPVEIKAYGRGGTCFRTIFEYIDEHGIEPENVIVATDLECDDFGPEPSYPVMWAVMQGNCTNAPWGEVLVVD